MTWCRDPDPAALDHGLRSIGVDADPLGDTITAVLDWDQSAPEPAAATAAGLPLSPGVQIHPLAIASVPRGQRYRRSARQFDRERAELIAPAGRQRWSCPSSRTSKPKQ